MKLEYLKKNTNKLLIFNKGILRNFEPKKDVLDANIKYWLNNSSIVSLKKGVYILNDKYEKEIEKDFYLEYIANQLIQPSYLSLEYVLDKYQLLSEPVSAITSVTIKSTREISNRLSVFRYYSISPDLFQGYRVKYFSGAPIMIAEKSKAIFDYLYLRFLRNTAINEVAVKELRINWENASKKEFKKVYSYLTLIKSKRVKKAIDLINKIYFNI